MREPITDIFTEGDGITVIAELPGVSKDDIKIEINGDILHLSAKNKDREYAKEILLPAKVQPGSLKIVYRNGILDIRLNKAQ